MTSHNSTRLTDTLTPVALAIVGLLVVAGLFTMVGVGQTQTGDSQLAVSASATGVTPGSNATVSIALENTGTSRSVSPVVTLDSLPEGWQVVNATSDGAAYRDSTNEFLWIALAPGGTGNATARIAIPANASGTETVDIRAEDADGNTANATGRFVLGGGGSGGGLPTVPLLVVGAGVVLLGAGWWYRSRNAKRTDPSRQGRVPPERHRQQRPGQDSEGNSPPQSGRRVETDEPAGPGQSDQE